MDKTEARAYIDGLPYIPARDQWPNRGNDTRWVVLHTIEGPEAPTSAEGCANYFANPGNRTASTQFCVDTNSTVRCAELDKVVAGAVGANHKGIHIEQAGVAAQTPAQWHDDYSMRMVLGQTAPLVAALCVTYDIPVQFVKADGLRAGVRGVTTHAECWKAFGGDYRSDPGDHYPIAELLDETRRLIDGTTPEDDTVTPEQMNQLGAWMQEQRALTDKRISTLEAKVDALLLQLDPAGVAAGAALTPSEPYLRQLVERVVNKTGA